MPLFPKLSETEQTTVGFVVATKTADGHLPSSGQLELFLTHSVAAPSITSNALQAPVPGGQAGRPAFVKAEPASPKGFPVQASQYPEFRYMGSKHRLLPWLHGILAQLDFQTAEDPFVGAGSVAYLLKVMGKSVRASDFLAFPTIIGKALVENSHQVVSEATVDRLMKPSTRHPDFISRTFSGIFFTPPDLEFLDTVWGNLGAVGDEYQRALILTALIRACMKRQPRGVFTVANRNGEARYNDGRRDLRLSLADHFAEQIVRLNAVVFDNGHRHSVSRRDVFLPDRRKLPDLVYLDPPYVPRADDNCYMKRYHFLEGLATYWKDVRILETSKVRKIEKPYTPFSYRSEAIAAFERLFEKYRRSTIVLSYSENGYPDCAVLCELLGRHKRAVTVHKRAHRYHFGTHAGVSRSETTEYVLVGTDG